MDDSTTIGENSRSLIPEEPKRFDVAIAGGGLAGLSLSIQLAQQGYSIILFEKEAFPFHRVCGEYLSMESWNFLEKLGVDLKGLRVSEITRLQISSPNGKLLDHSLAPGGFGLSRYVLDSELASIARNSGVVIRENVKVMNIEFNDNEIRVDAGEESCRAKVACGCFGKRSNIDIKWKRPFATATKNRLNNYIGVKYHIETSFPADTIALHNFHKGYCGLVKIEADKYNLCYLTTAENLRKAGGSVKRMEEEILCGNPFLKKIFSESEKQFEAPVIISQISFDRKTQTERHVLMIGDAA
ncbi:MAG: NAD(P)/FAD-dependent oxidoreductase, partial [Chitinophagaceae bacterium]|nr:NAD(P)/FAD-dependent oxidoreductase [Chitinophagaceae bacterium]